MISLPNPFTTPCPPLLLLLLSLFFSFFPPLTDSYAVDYSVYHNLERYHTDLYSIVNQPNLQDYIRLHPYAELTPKQNQLLMVQLTNFNRKNALLILNNRLNAHTKLNNLKKRKNYLLKPKLQVLISFGEHARELVVVESFFHFLHNLTEGLSSPYCSSSANHFSRFIVNHLDLHLIGLLNPDGKATMEQRKDYCYRNNGRGVDINRNTDWMFNGPGSSSQVGSEEYNGGRAFSEVETRFIRSLSVLNNYTAYISVHSGERQLFVPFVDSESKRMKRRRETTEKELLIANEVVLASAGWLKNSGLGYEMNDYSADGTLYDYLAGRRNIPYCFCVELWSQPTGQEANNQDCFMQFNPDKNQLPIDLERMHQFFVATLLQLIEGEFGVKYQYLMEERNGNGEIEASLDQLCEVESRLEKLLNELN